MENSLASYKEICLHTSQLSISCLLLSTGNPLVQTDSILILTHFYLRREKLIKWNINIYF